MGAFNNLIARVSGRSFGMGRATHPQVKETRDIPVPMRDGVVLLTDLYQPVSATPLPVFLTRTPYDRRAIGGLLEHTLAQRGYQVVSQSCRGTFGSGGEFLPFQSDKEDGVDTLKWIARQPWYSGHVVMSGLSYPGCAAWALAADAPEGMLSCLVIQHAASHVYDVFRPRGTVGLANLLNWVYLVQPGRSSKRLLLSSRRAHIRSTYQLSYAATPSLRRVASLCSSCSTV